MFVNIKYFKPFRNDKLPQLSIKVNLKRKITQLSKVVCTLNFETNERY